MVNRTALIMKSTCQKGFEVTKMEYATHSKRMMAVMSKMYIITSPTQGRY